MRQKPVAAQSAPCIPKVMHNVNIACEDHLCDLSWPCIDAVQASAKAAAVALGNCTTVDHSKLGAPAQQPPWQTPCARPWTP